MVSQFPWSQAILQHCLDSASSGKSRIFGVDKTRVNASFAALANGAFTMLLSKIVYENLAQEFILGQPSYALLGMSQKKSGIGGQELMKAVIIACEVMFRIGAASLHTSEKKGFHAPGLTGPYGSAIAAGTLMQLNTEQLVSALGIAGSLSAGLLAFN
jgi:2-methylcitrate dehydratase PrpD